MTGLPARRTPAALLTMALVAAALVPGVWWWHAADPATGGVPRETTASDPGGGVTGRPAVLPWQRGPTLVEFAPPEDVHVHVGPTPSASPRIRYDRAWQHLVAETLPPDPDQLFRGAWSATGGESEFDQVYPPVPAGDYELRVACAGVGAVMVTLRTVADDLGGSRTGGTWWSLPCGPERAGVHQGEWALPAGQLEVSLYAFDGTSAEVRFAVSKAPA